MMMCKKCSAMCGWIFLILGVLFLLRDIAVWDFWNIQWWTAIFVVIGVCWIGAAKCPDCQGMMSSSKKR